MKQKRGYALLFSLLLLLTGCIGDIGNSDSPKDYYSASGKVVDAYNNGIPTVSLLIVGEKFEQNVVVETDATGRWHAQGLLGAVEVTPTKSGWEFSPQTRSVKEDSFDVNFVGQSTFSIQTAIDRAKDGDIIVVPQGLYFENLDFKGKSIQLQGEDPDNVQVISRTIIDGRESGPVIRFLNGEGSDSSVRGFTLTGGSGWYVDGSYRGGGIFIKDSSPIISNNIFRENYAEVGSGIYVLGDSAPQIVSNTFKANIGENGVICYGVLRYGVDHQDGKIIDNMFFDNESYAIIARGLDTLDIKRNVIENNDGGIVFSGTSPENAIIEGNVIVGNRLAGISAGVGLEQNIFGGIVGTIKGNSFHRNGVAVDLGGSHSVHAIIENNIFTENDSSDMEYSETGGVVRLRSNSSGNRAPRVYIRNNEFSRNRSDNGGAIYIENVSGGEVAIENNTFTDNEGVGKGGALLIGYSINPVSVVNNQFNGNSSVVGGAIYVVDSSPSISGNHFTDNQASQQGGGIYIKYGASFTGENIFKNNKPDNVYYE